MSNVRKAFENIKKSLHITVKDGLGREGKGTAACRNSNCLLRSVKEITRQRTY